MEGIIRMVFNLFPLIIMIIVMIIIFFSGRKIKLKQLLSGKQKIDLGINLLSYALCFGINEDILKSTRKAYKRILNKKV